MPSCTFFGHRECPDSIEPKLIETVIALIVQEGVDFFYVGNQGRFDQLVLRVLRTVKAVENVPEFDYAVVQAYFPNRQPFYVRYRPEETMLPEGIEKVHPKFAISWRNDWMIRHSDHVVGFVDHDWGGAARYIRKAQKMGKKVYLLDRA